jgi:hypothetical protein
VHIYLHGLQKQNNKRKKFFSEKNPSHSIVKKTFLSFIINNSFSFNNIDEDFLKISSGEFGSFSYLNVNNIAINPNITNNMIKKYI